MSSDDDLFMVELRRRQPRETILAEDHNSKVDAMIELTERAKRILADIIYWFIDQIP